MSSCCFIVEIVINHIEFKEPRIENAKDLKITVQNTNFSLIIESDHGALADFRAGQSYEFYAFPELLRLEMQIFPITFTLFHRDMQIATTEMKWPEHIADNVDEDMTEIIHHEEVPLSNSAEQIGCMDLILRFKAKRKYEIKDKVEAKTCDLKRNISKSKIFYANDDELICTQCPDPNSDSSIKTFSTPSALSGCHKFEEKQNRVIKRVSSGPDDASQTNLRCCPICRTDVSWMPILVPCPKCNYVFDNEKPRAYNDKLTSEQILKNYAMSCQETSTDDELELPEIDKQQLTEKENVQSKPNIQNEQIEVEDARPLRRQKQRIKRRKRLRIFTQNAAYCNADYKPQDPRVTAYIKSLLPCKPKRHAMCARGLTRVPPHMGWRWTEFATGPNEKWRPGAIRRPIKEIMKWFLKDFPVDTIPVSRYAGWKTQQPNKQELYDNKTVQKPILHIQKKNKEYIITFRPLKKTADLLESVNPFLNIKPIRFRIIRDPISLFKHDLKAKVKNLGYSPCICHKPIAQCVCHSFKDKMEINNIVEQECYKNQFPRGNDSFVISDVSESDSEIDFAITPPIARMKPQNLYKPDYANVGTQYNIDDWCLKPRISIFGPPYKCKKPNLNINKCKTLVDKCPQNIQPPIIIPKIEKKPKTPTKKGKKGKKKAKSRGRRK